MTSSPSQTNPTTEAGRAFVREWRYIALASDPTHLILAIEDAARQQGRREAIEEIRDQIKAEHTSRHCLLGFDSVEPIFAAALSPETKEQQG